MGSQPIGSLAQLRFEAIRLLSSIYPPSEAEALVHGLLSHLLPDWRLQWLESRGLGAFPDSLLPAWHEAIRRLLAQEPLAYIIGKVHFGNLELEIHPGVFIPRPETEEWAYWLQSTLQSEPPTKVLDIGTGCGALALFLAKSFPNAEVYAIDKSPAAVSLARKNAFKTGLKVRVHQIFFGEEPLPADFPLQWDLIVSNPPYIPWESYGETAPNVRWYEPPDALFGGEKLYKVLGEFALYTLADGGYLVVELFPPRAEWLLNEYERRGFHTFLMQDRRGCPRWVVARRGLSICGST
ncbi:MAG: HemK/PrmC family methyltransferase [Bacteroidia bacterium]|nr:peptide chain release factor N(5)-glutamine methyltransferase [Bacteroidia bacterium]MDW8014556.1 HemK/PrmC family methyltransferase [Bacteroidia bacterium]